MDFKETDEDESWSRIDPRSFWCGSRHYFSLSLGLRGRAFFFFLTFSVISHGVMHGSFEKICGV